MHELFHPDLPLWNLAFRAAFVFIALLLMLRLTNKRQVAQLGLPDFVVLLIVSNAVQNSMNGGDNSLVGGLFMALVLLLLSTAVQFLTFRSGRLERLVQGSPTLLIHRGQIVDAHLKRELLSRRELHAMLRKQGVHDAGEVAEAVLESDGYLSIIKRGEQIPTGVREDIFDAPEIDDSKG